MVEELLLVEDMMNGKLGVLLAKEARALLKCAVSLLQKKKKRKRSSLLDTRVMDDPLGYKLSKAETATTYDGTPPMSTFVEPSPTNLLNVKGH